MKARVRWAVMAMLVLGAAHASAFTRELTAGQLQSALEARFPLDQNALFMTVRLSDPQVILKETSDRIGIEVTVTALAPGGELGTARGLIEGRLRYEPKTAQFFLMQPEVRQLDVAGVPDDYQDQLRLLVDGLAKQTLETVPVYTLRDDDPNQSLAKAYLQSVTVRHGRLVLELSLF